MTAGLLRTSTRKVLFAGGKLAGLVLLALAGLAGAALAQPGLGFTISVDGQPVAGDPVPRDAARQTDVALAHTDIQVKFDGLDVAPVLNALPTTMRFGYRAGESVGLLLTSNYPDWIERAEIRIFEAGSERPLAVLAARVNAVTQWTMPAEGGPQYFYVARVTDHDGRFDETAPLPLRRTEHAADDQPDPDLVAAGWGSDRTARRGITVFGGAVTVYGTGVSRGAAVLALGEAVPVDAAGAFVIQRLLPPGDHSVDVAVDEPKGTAVVFNRAINIPSDEWFYVAMGDLTLGRRFGDGRIVAADPSEFDGIYAKGRASFYLKGKIKGQYILTAAADTGEGPLSGLLSGALTTDPQSVLRRIDPNEYYPVYGDDSTLSDDAPTRGKLYVRLERGDSHVMWGTFRTEVGDSAFLDRPRVLYGASGVYKSDQVTAAGEHQASVSAYAALPGTLPARDELRGTGGSTYFLRRQDVVIGSETVSIEVRDSVTGLLQSRRLLLRDKDYRINALQGLVILAAPLQSRAPDGGAVQSGAGDDIVNLVVQYEYSPPGMALDDYDAGGSAEVWLNDHVAIGVSGESGQEESGGRHVVAANARLEASDTTFIKGEIAHSQGVGVGGWLSTDGGLTFVQDAPAGVDGAQAYRLNGQIDLGELSGNSVKGLVGGTFEQQDAGFAAADGVVPADQLIWSTFASLDFGKRAGLDATYKSFEDATGAYRHEASAELRYKVDPFWEIALGTSSLDLADPGGGSARNGRRTDAGVRVTHQASDDLQLYAFGQGTLDRSGGMARNDRIGVGGNWQLNGALALGGEAAFGTPGLSGLATISHQQGPGRRSYLGYRLNPADDGVVATDELSGLVVGTDYRYDDVVAVHAESDFSIFTRRQQTLTRTYGVTLTPDPHWTVAGGIETGKIIDPNASDFDRTAVSLQAGRKGDGVDAHLGGEVRLEQSGDGTRDRQTYLAQGGLNWQTTVDWQLQTSLDAVISNANKAAVLDGDYIKAELGFAYRPVDNDRLNALFRYTFLYDLPGPDQVTSNGVLLGPAQRSQVFSVDANYHLNEFITIGGKYGLRIGEVSTDRDPSSFQKSSAQLAILRADMTVLRDWDILLEGRVMRLPEAGTTDLGALVALYRDIGQNGRIGLGYNFGSFSDDLTDLVYDDHGVFVNLIAKY